MALSKIRMVQDRRFVVGIDLGGTSIKAGLVANNGKVVTQRDVQLTDRSPNAVLGQMHALVEQLRLAAPDRRRVLGAGLLVPAPVNPARGVIIKAANLGAAWKNVNVSRFFQGRMKMPIAVDNDANGFALGSWTYDFHRKPDHLIGLTLGTGVGGGIILNRQIWYGDTGVAGEIGHLAVRHAHSRSCGCGSNGCLELYASARALPRLAKHMMRHYPDSSLKGVTKLDGQIIADAAARGDQLAQAVFNSVGTDLGAIIGALVTGFGVATYSIGGKGARSFGHFEAALMATLHQRTDYLGDATKGVRVRPTKLGDHAAVIGAATLIFERKLHSR